MFTCFSQGKIFIPRELGACANSVYQALFPLPPHESLGTRQSYLVALRYKGHAFFCDVKLHHGHQM